MRKLIPLAAMLVLGGCSSALGPTRLRPGSNMVLPSTISVKDVIAKAVICEAFSRDSGLIATPGKVSSAYCRPMGPLAPPLTINEGGRADPPKRQPPLSHPPPPIAGSYGWPLIRWQLRLAANSLAAPADR